MNIMPNSWVGETWTSCFSQQAHFGSSESLIKSQYRTTGKMRPISAYKSGGWNSRLHGQNHCVLPRANACCAVRNSTIEWDKSTIARGFRTNHVSGESLDRPRRKIHATCHNWTRSFFFYSERSSGHKGSFAGTAQTVRKSGRVKN